MQPIQPKFHSTVPVVSSNLRNLSPVGPQVVGDQVELSKPPACEPQAPARAPKSFKRRLLKWAGVASLSLTASAGILGGIAYQANHQALVAPTVHVYPQQLAQPAVPSLTQQVKQAPSQPKVSSVSAQQAPVATGVQISVPAATLQQWLHGPKLQQAISSQLVQAQGQIQQQIGQVKVPSGQVLLDVTLPMPTSDASFLHLGGVDLPSLGYRALQTEAVPMIVSYRADPVQTGLKVDLQQVNQAPEKGPGLWVGGVKVTVSAPEGKIPVAGDVKLALDTQGQATRAQIDRLRQLPGQAKLIAQLESRLEQGQHVQKLIDQQGLGHLLEAGLNQNLEFQGHVKTGQGPLVQTTLNIWAVPDRNGDGKADLQITQSNQLENLRNLKVEVDQIGGDQAPSGRLDKLVHDQARRALISNLESQIPQLNGQLQQSALDQVSAQLKTQVEHLQAGANQQLGQAYGQLQLPGLGPVTQVKVGSGGVLLEVPGSPGGDGVVAGSEGLKPGQVAVGVDRVSLNQQLQQRVKWDEQLSRAGGSGYKLSWAPDPHGQPQRPELRGGDGKLFLHVELVAQKAAGTGQAPGFLDNVNTALDIPLHFRTEGGKLMIQADLKTAELQRLQAGGMDLSKLVPVSALTGLIGNQALSQTVDPAGWGGVRFEQVKVGPGGDLTVVVGTSPAAIDWATQGLR
ncbi:hypothetical protein JST97_32365 [bacterium]|nr:hypothetical protein [bacterium]